MNNTTQNTLPAVRVFDEIQIADGKIAITTGAAARAFADYAIKGGFAPKGMNAEGVALAVVCGVSRGIDPFAAMQGIAIVNGRPAIFGDLRNAIVKRSPVYGGEKIETGGSDDAYAVRVTCWRKGHEDLPTVESFSVSDAKRAGLWGKAGPWTQYPKTMIRNRALDHAYRLCFPDVLYGFYSVEEARDIPPQEVPPAQTVTLAAPAVAGRKPSSKLRDALGIPADAPVEEATFAPGGDPAPENAPSAPQDAQEAAPPAVREEIPGLDD